MAMPTKRMYADSVCECAEFRSAMIAWWGLSTERNYEKFHTLMQLGAMSLKNDSFGVRICNIIILG